MRHMAANALSAAARSAERRSSGAASALATSGYNAWSASATTARAGTGAALQSAPSPKAAFRVTAGDGSRHAAEKSGCSVAKWRSAANGGGSSTQSSAKQPIAIARSDAGRPGCANLENARNSASAASAPILSPATLQRPPQRSATLSMSTLSWSPSSSSPSSSSAPSNVWHGAAFVARATVASTIAGNRGNSAAGPTSWTSSLRDSQATATTDLAVSSDNKRASNPMQSCTYCARLGGSCEDASPFVHRMAFGSFSSDAPRTYGSARASPPCARHAACATCCSAMAARSRISWWK
mmetsp:Transcript_10731/g.33045  ORF Transcript_10731/g.33045 Transcript_10731/m.33045 type:complete len:296 (-) Transcript_10731:759-1646(-)